MSDDFNSMQQSAFASTRSTTVGDMTFNAFDWIPHDEWVSKKFKMKKQDRLLKLYEAVNIVKEVADNVRLVPHTRVTTYAELDKMERDYIAQGFEGVMACPNIPYKLGKSTTGMLKFKTFKSQDCEIIGFYEGSEDTKNVGRLGGVTVLQENGLQCDCGSGFSDDERIEIWNNRDAYLGRLIECKYQELTHKDIMRFPIKKKWRDNGANKGKR